MKSKIEAKHILGVIVAYFSAMLIHMEVIGFVTYFAIGENSAGNSLDKNYEIYGTILAVIIFIAVLFVFFKYVRNSLGTYLILSVAVSILMVSACLLISGLLLSSMRANVEYILQQEHVEALFSLVGVLYALLLILLFVVTFELMVKRKVKYLKYITAEVKQMEKSGFGKELQVEGDDELTALSQGISRMSVTLKEKQEIEKQEEEKRLHLIADISHDIRTPLTSVIGYTELIRENGFTEPEKCQEYIEVIGRRLSDMKTMLDQLFDYTKFNQPDYVLEKSQIDLVPLFHYIDVEYGRIYRKNNLGWRVEISASQIEGLIDTEKFMRAMANLLDNARKYAKKETEVSLSLVQQEKEILISLSNEVENPDALDEEKIFERFYKQDAARTQTSSTGLGLPIVKRIIELHDGTIAAEKRNGNISFVIKLPRK